MTVLVKVMKTIANDLADAVTIISITLPRFYKAVSDAITLGDPMPLPGGDHQAIAVENGLVPGKFLRDVILQRLIDIKFRPFLHVNCLQFVFIANGEHPIDPEL